MVLQRIMNMMNLTEELIMLTVKMIKSFQHILMNMMEKTISSVKQLMVLKILIHTTNQMS